MGSGHPLFSQEMAVKCLDSLLIIVLKIRSLLFTKLTDKDASFSPE